MNTVINIFVMMILVVSSFTLSGCDFDLEATPSNFNNPPKVDVPSNSTNSSSLKKMSNKFVDVYFDSTINQDYISEFLLHCEKEFGYVLTFIEEDLHDEWMENKTIFTILRNRSGELEAHSDLPPVSGDDLSIATELSILMREPTTYVYVNRGEEERYAPSPGISEMSRLGRKEFTQNVLFYQDVLWDRDLDVDYLITSLGRFMDIVVFDVPHIPGKINPEVSNFPETMFGKDLYPLSEKAMIMLKRSSVTAPYEVWLTVYDGIQIDSELSESFKGMASLIEMYVTKRDTHIVICNSNMEPISRFMSDKDMISSIDVYTINAILDPMAE